MTTAIRDQNHIPVKLGILCTDGVTTIPIKIDESTSGIMVDTTSTISYTPDTNVNYQDDNFVNVLMAEDENGVARPVNVNAQGAILIDL